MVWRLLFFTRVSATSADGSADGVEGWPGTEGDPACPQQTVRRMEPWGLHGRPATGIQSLVARVLAGAASGLQVGIWTGQHGRQNLEPGETQLYGGGGGEVFLDKNGKMALNSGSGQDVVLNGGSLQVARKSDPISRGTIVFAATGSPITGIAVTYTPGDASAIQTGTITATTPVTLTLHEQVDGGASRVKA